MCRRWAYPDPRVRESQRTCGREACRREQRRRTQRAYREAHPEYWTARRLREQAARAEASSTPPVAPPPVAMARVPWDLAQDAFGAQGAVLLGFLLRLAIRSAKDAMGTQATEITREFDRLREEGAQDATDGRLTDDYRPP